MAEFRYRLIDTSGSEIGLSTFDHAVGEGDQVRLPDGSEATIVEVYDDEAGREGGVLATVVVEEE
jgi:hypothetical protein